MLAAFACTSSHTIDGVWTDGAGKTVYLQQNVGGENLTVDSAVVAADESFSFDMGDAIGLYRLVADKKNKDLLVSEVPVTVKIALVKRMGRDSVEFETLDIKAEGDEQRAYEQGADLVLSSVFVDLAGMLMLSKVASGEDTSMSLDSASHYISELKAKFVESFTVYVDSARNNYGVTYFIKDYMIQKSSYDEVKAAYESLTDRVKNSAPGIELAEAIEALSQVSVGGYAPDVVLPTPDGGELALSSLRGHYVLVDFWASWCGPCLREVPNVKAIYDKYHDKGFEIYGISLDDKEDAWKAAIAKHGLNWHHVSSLQGWDCPVAKQYNVTGIPRMYILDPDGKIIAMNLRGEELAEFVAGLYE